MTKAVLIGCKVRSAFMPEKLLIGHKLFRNLLQLILNEIYSFKISISIIV